MVHFFNRRHSPHAGLVARQLPLLSSPDGGGTTTTSPSPAATPPAPAANSPANSPPAAQPPAGATQVVTTTSTQQVHQTTTTPNVVVVVVSTTTTPSRTTSSSSSTTRSSSTLASSTAAPSTSTHLIIDSVSASNTLNSGILAAASTTSSNNNGTSTGTIIGAVAGALVGVVVLSGLIGLLFRAKFGKKTEDDDDDDIFARDFRRDSVRLPDDDYDEMSQISGGRSSDQAHGVNRSDTLNSGGSSSGGPRPPTFIQRRMDFAAGPAQLQPSYQPGQLISNHAWAPAAGYGGTNYAHSQEGYSEDGLSRQGTQRSGYGDTSRTGDPYANHHGALPGVSEEDEEELPSRSGTPVDPNPQSAYYAHGSRNGSTDQASPAIERVQVPLGHRMSVRNGGYDDRDTADAYGGI